MVKDQFAVKGYEYVTDQETGGILAIENATGSVYQTVTIIAPAGSQTITPEQQELSKKRREFLMRKEQQKALGKFSFIAADQSFEKLSPETAARLVFLSTYLKYNSDELFLKKDTPLNQNHLAKLMRLSDSTVNRFMKEVCPKYIQKDEAGNLHMNVQALCRGKLTTKSPYLKIYTKTVRELYRATTVNNHRELGYIFKMLPYINIEYNILCDTADVFETDIDAVKPLSVKEFCDKISFDYKAVHRLKRKYKKMMFPVGDHFEAFCAFVEAGGVTSIYINPHIMYSGSEYHKVEVLGRFCNGI